MTTYANELDKTSLIQVAETIDEIQELNDKYSGINISNFFSSFGKSSISNPTADGFQYFYGAKLSITVMVSTNKAGIIRFVKAIK